MTEVRAALLEDRKGILDLCGLLHSENGQHEIYWPKVEQIVDRCLDKQGGVIGLIGDVGEPVGMIMLLLDPIWYSKDYQLLEFFNYVHPNHRKSSHAKTLIHYAKEVSEELAIDLVIGVLSNVRMEAKVRLYQRILPKNGEFFLYVPESKKAAMQSHVVSTG